MATPPPSAQLNRNINVTRHSFTGIPQPSPLEIDAVSAATSWRRWKSALIEFEVATDLIDTTERKRVSTLLSVISQDAKDIWQNHPWMDEENKYENYCTPRINVPYERHTFHSRKQRPGEDVMSWYNDLRRIGTNCAFEDITTDEIYRDHLVSSVRDDRVRDRLLEQRDLTLEKALDIIRSSEIKAEQAKAWNSIGDTDVHTNETAGKRGSEAERIRPRETRRTTTGIVVNCSCCGKTHDRGKCSAWGRKCRVCQGLNNFAAKCRKLKVRRDVRTVETEQYGVSSLKMIQLLSTR